MNILGIDPGVTGGFGLVGPRGDFVDCSPMPAMRLGTKGNKMQVDMHGVLRLLQRYQKLPDCSNELFVVLENVSAMPGQGVVSMFTFGRSVGRVEGLIAGLRVPLEYVTPVVWKRFYKLGKDKENSRALAQRLFPLADLSDKKMGGASEALLIARYWAEQKQGLKRSPSGGIPARKP